MSAKLTVTFRRKIALSYVQSTGVQKPDVSKCSKLLLILRVAVRDSKLQTKVQNMKTPPVKCHCQNTSSLLLNHSPTLSVKSLSNLHRSLPQCCNCLHTE